MTKIYEATFTKSSKEGRMGIKLEWCGFFVNGIKKINCNPVWNSAAKIWFFDAKDYKAVKTLVVESFESPIRIYEIDGGNTLFNLSSDWEGGIDVNSQDAQINAQIAGGSLNKYGDIY